MDQFVRRVLFVAFVGALLLALWKVADALLLAVFVGGLAASRGSEISNQLAELPRLLPPSYEEVLRTMERYKWSAPVAAALPESTDDLSSQLDLGEIGGVAKSLMNAGVTALVVLALLTTPMLVMAIVRTKILHLSEALGDEVEVPETTLLEDASAG